ncbi:MAG TPA: hypothetical protein ENN17_03415 [bacterium]|nr:hypothetical protein [bacterium]
MQGLRNSFYVVLIFSMMICLVVVSHRAVADVDSAVMHGHRADLPDRIRRGLERVDHDLRNARRLIAIDSGRILLEDKKDGFKEYRFAHGVLWCNDFPVIADLDAFDFGFRNTSGHRISPARLNPDLQTVEYTLKTTRNGRALFAGNSFRVPRPSDSFRGMIAMSEP